MFKRANKLTALLVAATSIMSVVPAMASDRLGTKDGTIENAVAFKDGKYVYQGYRSDDDDAGIYYNAGDKDKLLEDIEDADLIGSYSDKYAFANDGDDQYLVDLTNGDVIDDETPEDSADTAATKLKTALKKTDRYGAVDVDAQNDLGYTDEDNTGVLPGAKFGETWYQYSVTPEAGADGENNTVGGKLYGFTNGTGKYVDTSNLANIYAYSTEKGKFVKIEEFSNDIEDLDDDTQLLATLVEAPKVLTQDKDYIYAKVKVQIYDASATADDITGTTTGAAVVGDVDAAKTVTRTYIQKIAKAQGDKKDEAYLPKTVASYEVTKDELDSGDANDACEAIEKADSFSVVGSQLLAIEKSDDNVKVTTINLKKDKVKYDKDIDAPISLDNAKVDVYLAEKDDSDDVDIDRAEAVDIDVDGNVWAVADGKIYKFKDNEFTKVYTVDSSLDSISVYDESSLIVWEKDEDIYTTVNEGKAETDAEATPAAPAKTGWDQAVDGTWTFLDATGAKVTNNWVNIGGAWYFLKEDGVMATGWQQVGGTWYYLNASGSMATGWINDNGTWYYLQGSGAMATGWLNDNGTWYYLNGNGSMAANTTVGGYVLGASGAWVK